MLVPKTSKSAWKRTAVIAAALSVSPIAAWAEVPSAPTGHLQLTGGWWKKKPCADCEQAPYIVEPAPAVKPAPEGAAPEAAPLPGTAMPDSGAAPTEDVFAGALAVASSSATMSPNMFGDQFAGSTSGASGTFWIPGRLSGTGNIFFGPAVTVNVLQNSRDITVFPGGQVTVTSGQNTFALPSLPNQIDQSVPGTQGPTSFTPNAQTVAQTNAALTSAQPLVQLALLNAERAIASNPSSVLAAQGSVQLSGAEDSGYFDETTLEYLLLINSVILTDTTIGIPNPSDGGNVGRTKIADDNSPLPRDRVILNYDYFSNVPLVPGGWNVSRLSPGIEKTFFNRQASVEVRMPFASTLDSTFVQGAESTSTELGNLNITLKGLFLRTEQFAVAGGVGLGLPTASDTNVLFTDGSSLAQIRNEAVFVTPYVALLYTPTSRIFAQTWLASSFDTNGNPASFNADLQGLAPIGRLNDQALLQIDGQIGFWAYRSDTGIMRGLAPFFELHYNTSMGSADVISVPTVAGNALIGDLSGNIDDLTVSTGFVSQFTNNFNVSVGVVAPLKDGDDRMFDYQVGVRSNWYFGPTAADRNNARLVSNF